MLHKSIKFLFKTKSAPSRPYEHYNEHAKLCKWKRIYAYFELDLWNQNQLRRLRTNGNDSSDLTDSSLHCHGNVLSCFISGQSNVRWDGSSCYISFLRSFVESVLILRLPEDDNIWQTSANYYSELLLYKKVYGYVQQTLFVEARKIVDAVRCIGC